MHATSRFGYISDEINCAAHARIVDVLVVDGGAIVTANACVTYKYYFSLSSLLALSFESTTFQDLRLTRLIPLIQQKHKRIFILPVLKFLDETQQYDQE